MEGNQSRQLPALKKERSSMLLLLVPLIKNDYAHCHIASAIYTCDKPLIAETVNLPDKDQHWF